MPPYRCGLTLNHDGKSNRKAHYAPHSRSHPERNQHTGHPFVPCPKSSQNHRLRFQREWNLCRRHPHLHFIAKHTKTPCQHPTPTGSSLFIKRDEDYIMPPMPPIPGAPIGISGLSSFFSTITHSVVRNIPAIEAAFSKATRVTLAGSTTPAACKFS